MYVATPFRAAKHVIADNVDTHSARGMLIYYHLTV